ncbi:hypothetical protein [Arthrobacter zhaoguopingii]|uniref:hypothetical protein n=1 Tax=Arthrobacter zhaoguopingii TaxID=2681491 RepID=UPI0013588655|nr:hypothetical protein [Arthrobacter zhaoguopingii]
MTEDVAEQYVVETVPFAALKGVRPHDRVGELQAEATGHYFARFGTAFLIAADDDRSPAEEWDAVVSALRADPRVADVQGERATREWSRYSDVFPSARDLPRDCLLSGHDILLNVRFSDPLMFKLHVPRKNQPTAYDWTDLPSEDYWVGWDGVSIFVLWECSPEVVHEPPGGGLIAFDVLEQAAARAGMSLVVQACSPGCANKFAHTSVRVVQVPQSAGTSLHGIEGYIAVSVLSVDGGIKDVLEELMGTFDSPSHDFARMKNRARRLQDLENEARAMVSELLEDDYVRLSTQAYGLKRRTSILLRSIPASLKGKGHRRQAKHKIASLWLAMSGIEVLRRDWTMARQEFTDSAKKRGVDLFYRIDRKDDDNRVEAITLDFIRSAVEQQSSRIDNHTVATVTAVGAVAALAGAVAGGAMGGA